MMQDIEQHLCQLAVTFITAPMCGRIFTLLPQEHTSEQERLQSLAPDGTNQLARIQPTRAFLRFLHCLLSFCVLCVSLHPVLADTEE
jgi:hypothetical protein